MRPELPTPPVGSRSARCVEVARARRSPAAPLGVWILLLPPEPTRPSRSAHAMLPGLVLAALAGRAAACSAPAGGVLVAAAGDRARRRATSGSAATSASPWWSPALFGARRAARARRPRRRRGCEELLFGDLLGIATAATWPRRRCWRSRVAAWRCAVAHRALARPRSTARRRARSAPARALGDSRCSCCSAVGTVAAAPGLGSLLLVALMIAPAAAALRARRRLPRRARDRGRRGRGAGGRRGPRALVLRWARRGSFGGALRRGDGRRRAAAPRLVAAQGVGDRSTAVDGVRGISHHRERERCACTAAATPQRRPALGHAGSWGWLPPARCSRSSPRR